MNERHEDQDDSDQRDAKLDLGSERPLDLLFYGYIHAELPGR